MPKPKQFTDEMMIKAIENARGLIDVAKAMLGCSAQTIYERIKTSPAVADAVQRSRVQLLDFAELKLYNRIKAEDTTAIIFTLKTLGRDRGWREKQDVVNEGTLKVEIIHRGDPIDDGDDD
jgi:hypothetical protein